MLNLTRNASWCRLALSTLSVVLLVHLSLSFPADADSGLSRSDAESHRRSFHDSSAAVGYRKLLGIMEKLDDETCLPQLSECDPYGKRCCDDMKCGNKYGNYCLFFGTQTCYCLPAGYGQRIG